MPLTQQNKQTRKVLGNETDAPLVLVGSKEANVTEPDEPLGRTGAQFAL